MSIEYATELSHGCTLNLSEFAGWSRGKMLFEVLSLTPDKMSLRWLDKPPRVEWPEDAEISIDGTSILVSIHSGSQATRAKFIATFSHWLKENFQLNQDFEEL